MVLCGVLRTAEPIERPRERSMGERIDRGQLDELPELHLGFVPASNAKVGDAERFPNRRLLRLPPLHLLERHCRLAWSSRSKVVAALLEQVVGFADLSRLGAHRIVAVVGEARHWAASMRSTSSRMAAAI